MPSFAWKKKKEKKKKEKKEKNNQSAEKITQTAENSADNTASESESPGEDQDQQQGVAQNESGNESEVVDKVPEGTLDLTETFKKNASAQISKDNSKEDNLEIIVEQANIYIKSKGDSIDKDSLRDELVTLARKARNTAINPGQDSDPATQKLRTDLVGGNKELTKLMEWLIEEAV